MLVARKVGQSDRPQDDMRTDLLECLRWLCTGTTCWSPFPDTREVGVDPIDAAGDSCGDVSSLTLAVVELADGANLFG